MICILVYKYGLSLNEVLDFTVPQLTIFNDNLEKILKAESGKDDKGFTGNKLGNRLAFGSVVKFIKEKTGKDKVSLKDTFNPAEAIKKAK